MSRKGSRGGAEPRSNQNYHQEHEGHEDGVAREGAQNIIVCFVLLVVNNPLRVSAPPRALFLRNKQQCSPCLFSPDSRALSRE